MQASFPVGERKARIAAEAGAGTAASTPVASRADATLNRLIDSGAYMPGPDKRAARACSWQIAGTGGGSVAFVTGQVTPPAHPPTHPRGRLAALPLGRAGRRGRIAPSARAD